MAFSVVAGKEMNLVKDSVDFWKEDWRRKGDSRLELGVWRISFFSSLGNFVPLSRQSSERKGRGLTGAPLSPVSGRR